jgi:hypothetical protein
VAQEHLSDWKRLWDDFSQKETREEAIQGNQGKGDEDEENVALHAKKGRGDGKKDVIKVKCFSCHKIGHYASQCPNKKKSKKETQVAAWIVDSGSSRHMTRMRLMFLSVSETDLDCHVGCVTSTMHAVKGVGCVRVQLESKGSLEGEKVLFVLELKVSLLSVSALEDEGYGVMFKHGHVFIHLEGATLDTAIVLGIR